MFERDLKFGKEIEREFASRLMKRDLISLEFSQGQFKDWDVKAVFPKGQEQVERTYELKYDGISDRTGKVGIEYECNNQPSGIFTSKADYIVYSLGGKFYCVDRAKLLVWLTTAEKEYAEGGDGGRVKLYIVPKSDFTSLCMEV